MAVVRQAFKPEFLNRLDEIVVFDAAVDATSWPSIVDLQVDALGDAARATAGSPSRSPTRPARGWPSTGYDPAYGARPLRRLVQREIGDRLARALLAGEVRDGDTVDGRPRRGRPPPPLTWHAPELPRRHSDGAEAPSWPEKHPRHDGSTAPSQ